jgi:Fe-S-cluster containining protein
VAETSTAALDAGDFGIWLRQMQAVLRGDSAGTEVPCGDCVGCCSSHWPVALRAEDEAIVPLVPAWLLLEPEDAPEGVRYMGYREDGTCPMLAKRQCRVYARRPQTCRDFDCRVFTAAGLASAGPDKPLIDERVRRWRFSHASAADLAAHEAVKAAAAFLRGPARDLPGYRFPTSPIAIAGLALKAHEAFLEGRAEGRSAAEMAQAVVEAARQFEVG